MISLGIANNGAANDDHFEVIGLIVEFGKLPVSTQCWQCYHPKLFHFIVAQIWILFDINSIFWKQLSAQLVNVAFGLGTVLTIRKYVFGLKFKHSILVLVYALLVLNPRFISIFSQATNDALIIFLGNIGILALLNIFKKPTLKYSIILIAAITLGAMTKLNFGVYLIGTIITLVVLAFIRKNHKLSLKNAYWGTLILTLLFTGYALLGFNGYYKNLQKEGAALTYNTPLYELPKFFEYGDKYIPGIQTIYSGYFKFHYIDLIKHPQLIVENNEIRRHKHVNSHFSQIYGRSHYLYFDQWPVEWQTSNLWMSRIGSLSIALAMIPTLILILGAFLMIKNTFLTYRLKGIKTFSEDDTWVIILLAVGFLAFSMLFSLYGRTFVFMKAIYIMPGLILLAKPLATGFNYLRKYVKESVLYIFVTILCVLYMIPVIHLIIRMFQEKIALFL